MKMPVLFALRAPPPRNPPYQVGGDRSVSLIPPFGAGDEPVLSYRPRRSWRGGEEEADLGSGPSPCRVGEGGGPSGLVIFSRKTLRSEYVCTNKDIRYHTAEAALRDYSEMQELAGSIGSMSGKAAADSEIGTTTDGDSFAPDPADRMNACIDLKAVFYIDLDWRYKKVLDLFLDAESIRMYPERKDGSRLPGAHDLVREWAGCTPRHANWLIDKMLAQVDRNLWRMGYLYTDPDGVRSEEEFLTVGDNGLDDADIATALDMSTKWVSCPHEYAPYYTTEELEEIGRQSGE